jgi:hypothetical protein
VNLDTTDSAYKNRKRRMLPINKGC